MVLDSDKIIEFIENNFSINSNGKKNGLILTYEQKEFVRQMHNNKTCFISAKRQSGTSTAIAAYMVALKSLIGNTEDTDLSYGFLSYKKSETKAFLNRIEFFEKQVNNNTLKKISVINKKEDFSGKTFSHIFIENTNMFDKHYNVLTHIAFQNKVMGAKVVSVITNNWFVNLSENTFMSKLLRKLKL